MTDKLHNMGIQNNEQWVVFHCPGCEYNHSIPVTGIRKWDWNGSYSSPTITPSILVNVGGVCPSVPICHSFVTEGSIAFLSDSTHKLAGQTVNIPDWDL